jgi:hypothetical protein
MPEAQPQQAQQVAAVMLMAPTGTTFICPVDEEFTPRLNHEHDAHGWFDPQQVVADATGRPKRQRRADGGVAAKPAPKGVPAAKADSADDDDEAFGAALLSLYAASPDNSHSQIDLLEDEDTPEEAAR